MRVRLACRCRCVARVYPGMSEDHRKHLLDVKEPWKNERDSSEQLMKKDTQ